MIKPTLFAALTAIASCGHLELTQLDTFEGLAAVNGSSESCHYDATDMVWRFLDSGMMGEMDTLSGDYPSSAVFMQGVDNNDGITDSPLGIQYVAGTTTVDPRLYIADSVTGNILVYDINTESLLDAAMITLDSPGVNGLCYDSDNDVLYAANVGANFSSPTFAQIDGLAAIWKISDVSTSPAVTEIDVTNAVDQNGDALTESNANYVAVSGANRVFMPNGCAVLNGMVYFVETRIQDAFTTGVMVGGLGVYNPTADEFYVDTEKLDVSGDGLVAYGDYLIASSWMSFNPADEAGILLTYDTTDDSAVFEEALTGLVNPADIGVNDDGLLCVPSYNSDDGVLYFVQLEEHFDMTTTMMQEDMTTTMMQEDMTTTMMQEDMTTTMMQEESTMAAEEDSSTTEDDDENDDSEAPAHASVIIALFAACIAALF